MATPDPDLVTGLERVRLLQASGRLAEAEHVVRRTLEEYNAEFTEEQIIGYLKQADAGMPVKELCRKGGFSDVTFYKWRAKYGGMDTSMMAKLKELEEAGISQGLKLKAWKKAAAAWNAAYQAENEAFLARRDQMSERPSSPSISTSDA